MAFNLFGWRFGRPAVEDTNTKALVPPTPEDGALEIEVGSAQTYAVVYDLEGTFNNETDLINKYRDMSLYPECEAAINEVVNDLIIMENNNPPVEIQFGNEVKIADTLKEKIQIEFKECLRLLNFNNQAYEIVRRWYIDGKLYYQTLIDKTNPRDGIQEVRYIDPRQIRKVREVVKEKDINGIDLVKEIKEYFVYSKAPFSSTNSGRGTQSNIVNGIRIHKDDIIFCHSGLLNSSNTMVLSYLHKAIKPYNQLKAMEDALVIYRITRAPERRIFNIDVGEMPPAKAKQYLQDIMTNYRNKLVYNAETGEVRDDRRHSTMMEDFWFPVRADRKSEVTTLPGGQNLSEIADIEYFQKKLYKSLGIPITRLDPETGFNMGRASEITREELKFAAFIIRLRKRFSHLFDEILKKQLILKNITTEEDWDSLRENIYYDFRTNSFFAELKYAELMKERLDILDQASAYAEEDVKYFSKEYIQKKILHLTDDEVIEISAQLKGIDIENKTPQELEKELQAPEEESPDAGEDLNIPSPDETGTEEPTTEPEVPAEPSKEEGYDLFGSTSIDDTLPEEFDSYYTDMLLEEDGGGESGEGGEGVDASGDGGDFGNYSGDFFDNFSEDGIDPSGEDPPKEQGRNRAKFEKNKKFSKKGRSKKQTGIALMFHNLGKNYPSIPKAPKTINKTPKGKGKNSKKEDDK